MIHDTILVVVGYVIGGVALILAIWIEGPRP
jgi:hypothetical protein